MKITDVRIVGTRKDGTLKAFASVCFDGCFVVNDFKIIEANEKTFVCMPSKKSFLFCQECGQKVEADSRYCNMCGSALEIKPGSISRKKERVDIAHPINAEFRAVLVDAILEKYQQETTPMVMVK